MNPREIKQENEMKRTNFEASVCRESDQHPWRWFVSYQIGDEWESCIFDATPEGLDEAVRMDNKKSWLPEMVSAYIHACHLNSK